ncbi:KR domain-containing protein [Sesbania bispinosa]|nr:KR domain-containing protein [Sesbania bispinosa]
MSIIPLLVILVELKYCVSWCAFKGANHWLANAKAPETIAPSTPPRPNPPRDHQRRFWLHVKGKSRHHLLLNVQ